MSSDSSQIYGRGYGKLWPLLLEDPRLDSKAVLCYGVMGSFGPTRRASLKSIARRMKKKSVDSVRDAQRVLEKTQWIVLLMEGYADYPRVWWMNDRPGDHLKNEDVAKEMKEIVETELARRAAERGRKKHHPYTDVALAKNRGPKNGDPEKDHPKQELDLSNNSNSAKQEKTSTADAVAPSVKTPGEEVRTFFQQLYVSKHGFEMLEPGRGLINAETKFTAQLGAEEMKRRIRHYFDDPTRATHPYPTFLHRPDDWAAPRLKFEKTAKDDFTPKRRKGAVADWMAEIGLGGDEDDPA